MRFLRSIATIVLCGLLPIQSLVAAHEPLSAAMDADAALKEVAPLAEGLREKANIAHLFDHLQFTRHPELERRMLQTGVHVPALRMGMRDSDLMKIRAFWKSRILTKTPDSEQFFDTVRNDPASSSRATRVMRRLLQDNGYGGRGFLPPALSNDENRQVLQAVAPLRALVHQVGGMIDAVCAVNKEQISDLEFEKRIAANAFHDGTAQGYMFDFPQRILPQALIAANNPLANRFFRGTVFESHTHRNITFPCYPNPISVEGLIHTILDRLSQCTRGGITKIFAEQGGEAFNEAPHIFLRHLRTPVGDGVASLAQVLTGVPRNTLLQFNYLRLYVARVHWLTHSQLELLADLIRAAERRLHEELDFLRDRVVFRRDRDQLRAVTLMMNVGGSSVTVDGDTPAVQALAILDAFLRQEEALHGGPLNHFAPSELARSGGCKLVFQMD